MTCSECQIEIFEQELGRDALVHLTECEECRALDREVRLNSEALASMREDVMPVRAKRATKPWHWGVAVAAAAVAAFVLSFQTAEELTGPTPTTIVTKLPEPEVTVPVVASLPGTTIPSPPLLFPKMQLPAPPEGVPRVVEAEPQPLVVNLVSDDPDVVIYWLIDPIQGEQAI
jgi:hypothetical protein